MKAYSLSIVGLALFSFSIFSKTNTPKQIIKNTVIELTDDIIIDSKTSPVIASAQFGGAGPEKVIFTSKNNKSIIVARTGIWDLSSFDSKNKIIEFRGNAQLKCEPGAKIIFNNGLLRFAESTKWIIS